MRVSSCQVVAVALLFRQISLLLLLSWATLIGCDNRLLNLTKHNTQHHEADSAVLSLWTSVFHNPYYLLAIFSAIICFHATVYLDVIPLVFLK